MATQTMKHNCPHHPHPHHSNSEGNNDQDSGQNQKGESIRQFNVPPPPADNEFLAGLFHRTMKVTTTDGRWFVGVLKCSDRVS